MDHPRERSRRSGPGGGLLLERRKHPLRNAARKVGPSPDGIGRGLDKMSEPDLRRSTAGERRLADEAFVDDAAERVDVARPACLVAFDQLGGEVMRRPEDLPLGRKPGRVRGAREPEVGERRGSGAVEEHVRGLHVTVQDAARVERVESPSELNRQSARCFDPERAG